MIDYFASQCDYCGSSIVSGQRWVREKIFDPALNSPDAHYHWYHAEPFEGQEGSCWAKHEWNGKLSEPPPTPLREDIQKVGTRSEFNAAGVLRKEGNEEQAFSPSAMSRIPKTAQAKTSWSHWTSGRAEIVNLFAFHEQSKPCHSARLP